MNFRILLKAVGLATAIALGIVGYVWGLMALDDYFGFVITFTGLAVAAFGAVVFCVYRYLMERAGKPIRERS